MRPRSPATSARRTRARMRPSRTSHAVSRLDTFREAYGMPPTVATIDSEHVEAFVDD